MAHDMTRRPGLRAAPVVAAALFLIAGAGASPDWTAPTRLSSGEIAVGPETAVGAAGDALVVWDQEVGDVCAAQPANPACVHIVEADSRAPGAAAWPAPVEVARPGIGSAPRAALDPAGDGLVVWVHDLGEDRALQGSYRRGRSSAWPEPTDLSEVTRRIGAHLAALDGAGNATVVWAGTDPGGRTVVFANERAASSGVWGAPTPLSARNGNAPGGPSLAVNAAGDAVAVWTLAGPSGAVVQASFRPAASDVWSAPSALSAPGAEPDPWVAIDGAGDAVAVWSRGGVESSYRPSGGSWGSPIALSHSPSGPRAPQVALDSAGNALAIWLGPSGAQSAARSRSTAGWSAPTDVGGANAASPQLALDSAGNAVGVWIDARGTAQAALRPAASGRWLPAADVSTDGGTAAGPRVESGTAGGFLVAWNRTDPPRAVVEAADLAGAGPLLTSLSVPAAGTARVAIQFAVTPVPWASPLAGPPLWRFGDGGSGSGARTSHVYGSPGRYTVTVTQAEAGGGSATASVRIAIAAPTLRNTVLPSVLGPARVGAVLTCIRGSWSGTAPIRYAYGWLRAGRAIPGAGSARYRARAADAGTLVACRVVATNVAGSRAATASARRIHGGRA